MIESPPDVSPGGQHFQRKPRLLLAENEPSLWLLLSGLLAAEYEVEVVHDGEQAWAAIQFQTPDLLLTDLQRPVLDGIGLARRLRADARTITLPIVFLTGCTVKGTRLRCLEAGGSAFMVKPFHVSELLDWVADRGVMIARGRKTGEIPGRNQFSQDRTRQAMPSRCS